MTTDRQEAAPSAVLARVPDDAWVAVGDEIVVHRASPSTTVVLSPVAGLLWRCVDGVSPLAEIIDDIAAVYGTDRREVERDCLRVARSWLDLGLVEEVTRG